MKTFSKFEITNIKRTAQNVNRIVTKKLKIEEKLKELQEEYDTLVTLQEQYELPIRTMTGGFGTEDLIDKVVEETENLDKNGNPVKVTKWVLKYPDTIIPDTQFDEAAVDEIDDTEKAPEIEVRGKEDAPEWVKDMAEKEFED